MSKQDAAKLTELKARVTPKYLGLSSEDATYLVSRLEALQSLIQAIALAGIRMVDMCDGWGDEWPCGDCPGCTAWVRIQQEVGRC